VHGGSGYDFMEANAQAYAAITRFHAQHGTTGMLATTVTASPEAIIGVLDAAAAFRQSAQPEGARLWGVHLEGPYISPKWPGAQNPGYIALPQVTQLEEWCTRHEQLVKIVTLAPEQPGATQAIEWLTSQSIVAACGHTDATFAEISLAADHGLRHAVHTYNAMRGLHHREPGTVGAVLIDDRITAEVIADGHHVHPAAVALLAKAKGPDRLLMVTDAISAAGLGDGPTELGGLAVEVQNGVARLKDGGALAGSTLTMASAFRYMVQTVGLDVPVASRMGSGNPARLLGIDTLTGSIAAGKHADLLLFTPELELAHVWVGGQPIGL